MRYERKLQTAALAACAVLYAAARIWGLTDSCLWFDEIFSVHAAEHEWNSLLGFVSLDLIHPPLFYLLLKAWISIGGDGLLWLRLFPVAWSVLAVFPFIALCRELKIGRWTQVLALLLLAVNGALIKYAQEVRMYAPLLCLSLFSIWLFARYFIKGKSFVPLVIVNVLMVYTHYFGWFVVLSEVVLVLWFQRIKWRRMAVMFGVVFAAFLPWLIAVAFAARGGSELGQNIGWMSRPGVIEIIGFVLDVVEPFYYQASNAEPSSYFIVSIPMLVLIGAAKIGFLTNVDEADRQRFYLLGALTGIPIAATLLASWIMPYSIWGTRHLIIVFPPMIILSAVFLTGVRHNTVRACLTSFLLLLVAGAFWLRASRPMPEYPWCVLETLTREWILTPQYSAKPRHMFATEELIAYHMWFAARNFPNSKVSVLKKAGTAGDPAYFLPRGFAEVAVVNSDALVNLDEFWVAFRDPDPNYDLPGIPTTHESPRVLTELYYLGFQEEEVLKRRVGKESLFLARMVRRQETQRPKP